jgi:hypothetical protein
MKTQQSQLKADLWSILLVASVPVIVAAGIFEMATLLFD